MLSETEKRVKELEQDRDRLKVLLHQSKTEYEVDTAYLSKQVRAEHERQMQWKDLYFKAHAELTELRQRLTEVYSFSMSDRVEFESGGSHQHEDPSSASLLRVQLEAAGGRFCSVSECLPLERISKPAAFEKSYIVDNRSQNNLPALHQDGDRLKDSSFDLSASQRPPPVNFHRSPGPVFESLMQSPVNLFSRSASAHASESPRSLFRGVDNSFFKCVVCGEVYDTEEKLRFHVELHNEGCRVGIDTQTTECEQVASPGEPLACPECSLVISSEEEYRRHLMTHALKCKYCSQTSDSEVAFLLHLKGHGEIGEQAFQCFLCEKQFSHLPLLTRHVLSHPDDRSYECVECGKHFSRKGHMTRHMAMHSGCRPYTCTDCGKDFAHRTHLRRHEIVHSGLRPFRCNVCHQTFSRKSSLSRHYFIHTTEKPFVCPVCQKGFNRKGRLRNHLRIHIREGYPDLAEYKIERRPITKEFIEHVNKVPLLKVEGGGNYPVHEPRVERGSSSKTLSVSSLHAEGSPSRESDAGDIYREKEDSEDSSSSDSEDGDGEDHLSDEISYFDPGERSRRSVEHRDSAQEDQFAEHEQQVLSSQSK